MKTLAALMLSVAIVVFGALTCVSVELYWQYHRPGAMVATVVCSGCTGAFLVCLNRLVRP